MLCRAFVAHKGAVLWKIAVLLDVGVFQYIATFAQQLFARELRDYS